MTPKKEDNYVTLVFKCPECGIEFKITKRHGTKFNCKKCGHEFVVPIQLTKDSEVKRNQKLTKCPICNKLFIIKGKNLDKPGTCYKCENTFIMYEYPKISIKEI